MATVTVIMFKKYVRTIKFVWKMCFLNCWSFPRGRHSKDVGFYKYDINDLIEKKTVLPKVHKITLEKKEGQRK